MELSTIYSSGHRSEFPNYVCLFYIPEDCFILKNSADPDEMPQCVAFHLGLHCLPKYMFQSLQFSLIFMSQSTLFQACWDVSPWLEPVLSSG